MNVVPVEDDLDDSPLFGKYLVVELLVLELLRINVELGSTFVTLSGVLTFVPDEGEEYVLPLVLPRVVEPSLVLLPRPVGL